MSAQEREALVDLLVMSPMSDHVGTSMAPIERTADALLAAGWTRPVSDEDAIEAEVERLRQWKTEASEVMLGLQDLGRALGLRPGERITGERAAEVAAEMRATLTAIRELTEPLAGQWNGKWMTPDTFDRGVGALAQDVLAILDADQVTDTEGSES